MENNSALVSRHLHCSLRAGVIDDTGPLVVVVVGTLTPAGRTHLKKREYPRASPLRVWPPNDPMIGRVTAEGYIYMPKPKPNRAVP